MLVARPVHALIPGMSTTHTVASGESLSVIAQKYGVSVDDIIEWNAIDNPDLITVGQVLEVSAPAPSRTDGDPSINPVFHVVAAGETLGTIAKRYRVPVDDLASWNDLSDPDRITAGQKLRIGPKCAQTHMVQPGDTVIGISEKLAVSWEVVDAQNKLANPDLIYPEQVLVIRQDARLR